MSNEPLLTVENLQVSFATDSGMARIIDDFSFEVRTDEVVGFVGESGAGKSVTWQSVIGLLEDDNATIDADRLEFRGQDLLSFTDEQFTQMWRDNIGIIFQQPTKSLNPTDTVGNQIREVILNTEDVSKAAGKDRAIELMADVGIPAPADRYSSYPHEFSGGMNQRVMIAIALACDPELIIADEPTSALDVTIQSQILDLLEEKKQKYDLSLLYISHDLSVISEICERVVVVYAGYPVEKARIDDLIANPLHPYTIKLIDSIPRLNDDREYLSTIDGTMPEFFGSIPDECRFCDRCEETFEQCEQENPTLLEMDDAHQVRCFLYE